MQREVELTSSQRVINDNISEIPQNQSPRLNTFGSPDNIAYPRYGMENPASPGDPVPMQSPDGRFNEKINQTNQDFNRLITRYQSWIFFISALIQIFNSIYILTVCWAQAGMCVTDGIEIRAWSPHLMALVFFVTIIVGTFCYYSSERADKTAIRWMKWLNFLYIIFTLILAIVGFGVSASVGANSLKTQWAKMSQLERMFFNDTIGNLVDRYQKNMILFGVYMIILAILFALLTLAMFWYDNNLQDGWRPVIRARTSFATDVFLKFKKDPSEILYSKASSDQMPNVVLGSHQPLSPAKRYP